MACLIGLIVLVALGTLTACWLNWAHKHAPYEEDL